MNKNCFIIFLREKKSLVPEKMEQKGSKKIKGLNRQNSISAPPSPIKRQGSSFDKLFEETKGSFEIIEEEYEDDVDDQQQHLIAPKSPKKILFSSYCKFFPMFLPFLGTICCKLKINMLFYSGKR